MLGRPNTALSQIHMQIMWSRLSIAVVEERAQSPGAHRVLDPGAREAGDLSAGVFDRDGKMLAQAVTGTPGHVNSMAAAVKHFLDAFPLATMKPGDHYITNDPWLTCGHLHDLTVVSPTFLQGEPVRALRQRPCMSSTSGGSAWGRTDGRCTRRACDPADGLGARRPDERRSDGHHPRQCRAEPLQVEGDVYALAACNDEGSRTPRRDDGGVRDQQSRPARRAHHRNLARRDPSRSITQIAGRGKYKNEVRMDGYDRPLLLTAQRVDDRRRAASMSTMPAPRRRARSASMS